MYIRMISVQILAHRSRIVRLSCSCAGARLPPEAAVPSVGGFTNHENWPERVKTTFGAALLRLTIGESEDGSIPEDRAPSGGADFNLGFTKAAEPGAALLTPGESAAPKGGGQPFPGSEADAAVRLEHLHKPSADTAVDMSDNDG